MNDSGCMGARIYPALSATMRPALLTRLLPVSFGDFLHAIASGTNVSEDLTAKHSFCASVRLSIPPYPCDGLPEKFYKAGVPIQGLTEKNLSNT